MHAEKLAKVCSQHSGCCSVAPCESPDKNSTQQKQQPQQHRRRTNANSPSTLNTHQQPPLLYLVVVGGHPGQQYECAPVVAKVAHDDGPNLLAGQKLAPGNAVGALGGDAGVGENVGLSGVWVCDVFVGVMCVRVCEKRVRRGSLSGWSRTDTTCVYLKCAGGLYLTLLQNTPTT